MGVTWEKCLWTFGLWGEVVWESKSNRVGPMVGGEEDWWRFDLGMGRKNPDTDTTWERDVGGGIKKEAKRGMVGGGFGWDRNWIKNMPMELLYGDGRGGGVGIKAAVRKRYGGRGGLSWA